MIFSLTTEDIGRYALQGILALLIFMYGVGRFTVKTLIKSYMVKLERHDEALAKHGENIEDLLNFKSNTRVMQASVEELNVRLRTLEICAAKREDLESHMRHLNSRFDQILSELIKMAQR